MKWTMIVMLAIGMMAVIGLGFLIWNFDPYQTSIGIKTLFFSMLGLIAISIIGFTVMIFNKWRSS